MTDHIEYTNTMSAFSDEPVGPKRILGSAAGGYGLSSRIHSLKVSMRSAMVLLFCLSHATRMVHVKAALVAVGRCWTLEVAHSDNMQLFARAIMVSVQA